MSQLFDEVLRKLNGLFELMFAEGVRESIVPEKLLRVQLPKLRYSIRSDKGIS